MSTTSRALYSYVPAPAFVPAAGVSCTLVVGGRKCDEVPRVMELTTSGVCLLVEKPIEEGMAGHLILTNNGCGLTRVLELGVGQVTPLSSGGMLVNCRFRTALSLEELLALLPAKA